jgi:hypothetical protein
MLMSMSNIRFLNENSGLLHLLRTRYVDKDERLFPYGSAKRLRMRPPMQRKRRACMVMGGMAGHLKLEKDYENKCY